jgi:hypothetical protein
VQPASETERARPRMMSQTRRILVDDFDSDVSMYNNLIQ